MFLRAYKICDMEFLDDEIRHIKEVFYKHGHSEKFIHKAHSKARKSFYNTQEKREFLKEQDTMLVLPQTELSNKFLDDYLIKCNIKAVF